MTTSTTQASATSQQTREALRTDLESTRAAFHALVVQVSEADWNRPTQTTKWTIGEVICHITSYLDMVLPLGLTNARKGKNMPKMPGFIVSRVNFMMARSYTRKQSHQGIAACYDAAHARALDLLNGVGEVEWGLTTAMPIGKMNVEELFKHHTRHFQLHREDILFGLNHKK